MALTFDAGETQVREETVHLDVDDPRASSTKIQRQLNQAYKRVRRRLQEIAPRRDLKKSGSIVVDQDNDLDFTPVGGTFDSLFLVERLNSLGKWDPMERADDETPRQHQLYGTTFRLEGGRIIFEDADGEITVPITVRMTYWVVPFDLTTSNQIFDIPECMEVPLVLFASAALLGTDQDKEEALALEARAEALIKEATPTLRKQYGVHKQRSGLNRSVNWNNFGPCR